MQPSPVPSHQVIPSAQHTHLTFAACSSFHSPSAQPFPLSQALSPHVHSTVCLFLSAQSPPLISPAVLMLLPPHRPQLSKLHCAHLSSLLHPALSCQLLLFFLFLHSRLGCSCSQKGITLVPCRRSPAHFQAYLWSSGQIAQLGQTKRGPAILMSSPEGLLTSLCIYISILVQINNSYHLLHAHYVPSTVPGIL